MGNPKNTGFGGNLVNPNEVSINDDISFSSPDYDPPCPPGVFVTNSTSVAFSGSGSTCDPLVAYVILSQVSGNNLVIFQDGLYVSGGTGGGLVTSVFGRLGDVVAQTGDYSAFYYGIANPSGFISGITSGMIVSALGYTPLSGVTYPVTSVFGRTGDIIANCADYAACYYSISNPSGFISGINSAMVITALGYVPLSVASGNTLYYPLASNPAGYLTVTSGDARYYLATNPSGYISAITSLMVTNALGFIPASGVTNPISNIGGKIGLTLSPNANNTLQVFANGLFASNFISGVTNPLLVTTGVLSLKTSATAGNLVQTLADGLFVSASTGGATSVSNADGTLTISPTTGAVVASINLNQANTWASLQSFSSGIVVKATSSGNAFTGGIIGQNSNSGLRWSIQHNESSGELKHYVSNGGYFPTFYSNNSEVMRLSTSFNMLVGATADISCAKVLITSTTQGVIQPRLTTTQRNAVISPVAGLEVYDSTINSPFFYDGAAWRQLYNGSIFISGVTNPIINTAGNIRLAISAASGNTLQVNGDGLYAPTGPVLLSSGTTGSVSTLSLSLLAWFASYHKIVIELQEFLPVTNGSNLQIRLSADGTTYDSGATNYQYMFAFAGADGTSSGSIASTGSTSIIIAGTGTGISNTAGKGWDGSVTLYNPGTTAFPKISYVATYMNSAGLSFFINGGGVRMASQQVQGIQFLTSSGNIASGTFQIWGYK